MKTFPYPYYFYGSEDSTDVDVIIHLPKTDMPSHQEDRKRLVWKLTKEHQLNWNATLMVVENGYVVDTIHPKAWVDALNNSLWNTYHLHNQEYSLPIKGELSRHYLLAIYKAVRTVLCMFTRTQYRPIIRPILKGIHPFHKKIDALKQLDFNTVRDVKQINGETADIWKTVAFYMGQNISLIRDDIEIYTKQHFIQEHPSLVNFIYRKPLNDTDFEALTACKKEWLILLDNWGEYTSRKNILSCKGETVNMHEEISVVSIK